MAIKSAEDFTALDALLPKIQGAPPDKNPIWVALNKLKTVHFARFVSLAQHIKLAVITNRRRLLPGLHQRVHRRDRRRVQRAARPHGRRAAAAGAAEPSGVSRLRAQERSAAIEPFYSACPQATVLDIHAALENA